MALELVTDRLTLRRIAPNDCAAHISMIDDPRAARFLTFDGAPPEAGDSWRSFASMLGHWELRGFGFFSVFTRPAAGAPEQWVGRVGPWMPEGWPALEVGWGIAPAFWGRGYAPEAAIAAANWLFRERPDLDRIISLIDADNENSQAVARKIGESRTDETFDLKGVTLDVWAAPRAAWLSRFGA